MSSRSRKNNRETEQTSTLEEYASKPQAGIAREFFGFLLHNKKWWLTPIVLMLLLIGLLVVLGGSGAARRTDPLARFRAGIPAGGQQEWTAASPDQALPGFGGDRRRCSQGHLPRPCYPPGRTDDHARGGCDDRAVWKLC